MLSAADLLDGLHDGLDERGIARRHGTIIRSVRRRRALQMAAQGVPVAQIVQVTGWSKRTVYRWLAEAKADSGQQGAAQTADSEDTGRGRSVT